MVYPTNTEQGLDFKVHGQEWEPVDYEGLKLIMRPNTNQKQINNQRKKVGWSTASRFRKYGR